MERVEAKKIKRASRRCYVIACYGLSPDIGTKPEHFLERLFSVIRGRDLARPPGGVWL